jgi:hypothetical protein
MMAKAIETESDFLFGAEDEFIFYEPNMKSISGGRGGRHVTEFCEEFNLNIEI